MATSCSSSGGGLKKVMMTRRPAFLSTTSTTCTTTTSLITCTAATTLALLYYFQNNNSNTTTQSEKESSSLSKKSRKIIECDLMERIAKKSYLQPMTHTIQSSHDNNNNASSFERPKGIPRQLRILVIDLPEFREMMDQECRVDLKHLFCDGVAPPKRVEIKHHDSVSDNNGARISTKTTNIDASNSTTILGVMQKSLATSLTRCGSNDGVLLLEASVSALDGRKGAELLQRMTISADGNDAKRNDEEKRSGSNSSQYTSFGRKVAEEENASSNQYAWIEELHLRLQGRVPFGATLEPSSSFSRHLFGNVYRWTSRSWFWRRRNMDEGEDVDGSVMQSKPHAVIADGGALNTVPGALRELVAACRASNVPLWVINDPRVWVTTEHNNDLEAAAVSLRKEIKAKIVANALRIKEGTTFERGRYVGRTEAELKHTAKEAVNTAKRLASQLKRDSWKKMSKDELRLELIRRGVCNEISSTTSNEKESTKATTTTETKRIACTDAMVDLCRLIITQGDATEALETQESTRDDKSKL
eukprot:CAMPEP_0196818128 /NCGR_PEP_ID=MMETSP1362-20130617/64106_1 /TAXON_ID=163516 /ORGANISM="Leptocylindrus danicus, Strain CCMP1856" /LENGTH=531 /DNA_ID=CAMNT_0042196083 /DNA_START=69 /DNA_END=1664 /DNA_ORIENTATION=-